MINTCFDFTTDSKGYWDGFWDRGDGLGEGGCDPDKVSATLRNYHQLLWSKELPNGQYMELQKGKDANYDYLTWKDFRFGSDTIIIELRYLKYRYVLDQVFKKVGDYKKYYEDLIRKSYTIGGTIIFPKHQGSINQAKGTSSVISDRWDLTMECIRRFYLGEKSPLSNVLEKDKAFFDLFCDFKGYVDYFLLQDCVSEDYTKVDLWCGDSFFEKNGLPLTMDDYFKFIGRQLEFLDKRNDRIKKYCKENGL